MTKAKKKRKKSTYIDRDLIEAVERCIAERGLTPTSFGEKSINDPDLVRELRNGRQVRWETRKQIEAFIEGVSC